MTQLAHGDINAEKEGRLEGVFEAGSPARCP